MEGMYLEMLGTETPLALQHSHRERSAMEDAALQALDALSAGHRTGAFKSIVCNDEAVWESHGIPMASLSRYPYPEYHTDRDNLSILSERALEESLAVLLDTVERLESTAVVTKKFKGTICVSNPRFDLYVDPGEPAFGTGSEEAKRLRLLMDLIPLLDAPVTVDRLARDVGLSVQEVTEYLARWKDKGLLDIR